MATNPRIPDSRGPQLERGPGGLKPVRPKGGGTGTALAIIVAALLLAAIFYFMPRAPKASRPKPGAEVPVQPTPGQIQIQNVNMSVGPNGNGVTLQGLMTNQSGQVVNGIGANVVFHGNDGTAVATEPGKIYSLKKQGDGLVPDDLVKAPLKPNDTRPFRVEVANVPQGWNHQMPELQITVVTSHP